MIPKKSDNPKGLHQRYIVAKSNGKPVDPKAEYFVLRVDKNGNDPKHIDACRKAVLTYAENIRECLPELAQDLIDRYGSEQLILPDVSDNEERVAACIHPLNDLRILGGDISCLNCKSYWKKTS